MGRAMPEPQRYDVSFQKEGELGKRFFVKIGVAFSDPKTGRIAVKLDTLPINWNGKLTLFPKPEEEEK